MISVLHADNDWLKKTIPNYELIKALVTADEVGELSFYLAKKEWDLSKVVAALTIAKVLAEKALQLEVADGADTENPQ